MSNLVQLYDENKNKAYPIVNNKAIINEDGTSTIETIEKKITLNMNELKENMNETY